MTPPQWPESLHVTCQGPKATQQFSSVSFPPVLVHRVAVGSPPEEDELELEELEDVDDTPVLVEELVSTYPPPSPPSPPVPGPGPDEAEQAAKDANDNTIAFRIIFMGTSRAQTVPRTQDPSL
jgi:hypothetical protein